LLTAVVVMATRLIYGATTGMIYEDALITLRYARNLAEGHGLVFNVGERVLGTTTPLFALLLAPAGVMAGDSALIAATRGLGVLATGATVWLFFRLCRLARLPDAVPLGASLLLAVSYELVVAGVAGMETMLIVALMLAGLVLLAEGRPRAAGIVLGLLVVGRVDGALWVALVVGHAWWRDRRVPVRALTAFAATLLPWVVFATVYYGSPVPHTMAAKMTAYAHGPLLLRARAAWQMMLSFEPGAQVLARGLDLLLVVGAVTAVRRRLILAVPALACPLYVLLLVAFAPQVVPWHYVPAVACYVIVAAFGALITVQWAMAAPRAPGKALRIAFPAGLALVALGSSVSRTAGSIAFNRRATESQRAVTQAAGEWIAASTPVGATLFAEPIGFLGFYSRRYLWDTVGIVSPVITEYRRRFPQANRWFWESLHDLHPDLVVLRDFERAQNRMFVHGRPLLPPEGLAWFDTHYRAERTFAPPWPGPEGSVLIIYRRSDVGVTGTPAEKASKN
jgi:arabinofuranosyltransferase